MLDEIKARAEGTSEPAHLAIQDRRWLLALLAQLEAAAAHPLSNPNLIAKASVFEGALREIFTRTQCISQFGFCPHCHSAAALERAGSQSDRGENDGH